MERLQAMGQLPCTCVRECGHGVYPLVFLSIYLFISCRCSDAHVRFREVSRHGEAFPHQHTQTEAALWEGEGAACGQHFI